MTHYDLVKLKVQLLKGMNDYIIYEIGDEEQFDYWFMYYPDEATEDYLTELVCDTHVFEDCAIAFGNIVLDAYADDVLND